MPFEALPSFAAWRHRDAQDGFEIVFLKAAEDGYRLEGATSAVEAGEAWAVRYALVLASDWTTRNARVSGLSATGSHDIELEAPEPGRWRVNGEPAPHLDGLLDVDLESSSLTNAFPVHRLGLDIGQEAGAPAAYIRALDLSVERLEQRYVRLDDEGGHHRYHYASPQDGFECELTYDESGLVLDYPGIALRAA